MEATSSGPDVEPLAAAAARLIVAATDTDVCFVHVLDDTGGSLTLVGATPPFDGEVGTVRIAIGTGVTGWVAEHGRPVARAGTARLEVADDGRGFDLRGPDLREPDAATVDGTRTDGSGYGMRSMTERTELVGGSLRGRLRSTRSHTGHGHRT